MTFMLLTSCDNDTPADESSSETSKVEETSTQENIDDLNEEKLGYTFYQADCDIFHENTLPKIINNYNDFSAFVDQYIFNTYSKEKILSKINEKEFYEYFVVVMSPSYDYLDILQRVYTKFLIEDNEVKIYTQTYYCITEHTTEEVNRKSDFVLVPRSLYSEGIQEMPVYLCENDFYFTVDNIEYNEYLIDSDNCLIKISDKFNIYEEQIEEIGITESEIKNLYNEEKIFIYNSLVLFKNNDKNIILELNDKNIVSKITTFLDVENKYNIQIKKGMSLYEVVELVGYDNIVLNEDGCVTLIKDYMIDLIKNGSIVVNFDIDLNVCDVFCIESE